MKVSCENCQYKMNRLFDSCRLLKWKNGGAIECAFFEPITKEQDTNDATQGSEAEQKGNTSNEVG